MKKKKLLKLSTALLATTSLAYGVAYGIINSNSMSNSVNLESNNTAAKANNSNGMLDSSIASYDDNNSVMTNYQAIKHNGMTIADNSNRHMLLATTTGYALIDTSTLGVVYNYTVNSETINGTRQIVFDEQTGLFYILSYYGGAYHFLYVNPQNNIGGELTGSIESSLDNYVMSKNATPGGALPSYLLYYRGELASNADINTVAPIKIVILNSDNSITAKNINITKELNKEQRRYIVSATLIDGYFANPSSTLYIEYYMPERSGGALSSVWAWSEGHFSDDGVNAELTNETWYNNVNPAGYDTSDSNIMNTMLKCNPLNQAKNFAITNNIGNYKKSYWIAFNSSTGAKLISLAITIGGGQNDQQVKREYISTTIGETVESITSSYYNGVQPNNSNSQKQQNGFSRNNVFLCKKEVNGATTNSVISILGSEGPYSTTNTSDIKTALNQSSFDNARYGGLIKKTIITSNDNGSAYRSSKASPIEFGNFYSSHDGNTELSFSSTSKQAWAVALPNHGYGSWAYSIFPQSIRVIKPQFNSADFVSNEDITMDEDPFNDNNTLKQKIIGEWKTKIFVDASKYPKISTSDITTFNVVRDTENNKLNISMQFTVAGNKSNQIDFTINFKKQEESNWWIWAAVGGGVALLIILIIIGVVLHIKNRKKQDDLSRQIKRLVAKQTTPQNKILGGPSQAKGGIPPNGKIPPNGPMPGHMGGPMNGPIGAPMGGPKAPPVPGMGNPKPPMGQGPVPGPVGPPPPPPKPPVPGARAGSGAQRPGTSTPPPPPPPKIEINAPPKSLAPKRK